MARGSCLVAAALVLAAACCRYPGAAGSAALVLAARGSAAGRIVGALLAAAEFAAAGQVDESEGTAGRWWLGPWMNTMRGAPDVAAGLGDAGVIKDQRRLDDTSCESVCVVSTFLALALRQKPCRYHAEVVILSMIK